MHQAFIAIGSNLESPQHQVEKALIALSCLTNTSLIKQSSLYESKPFGYDNQPNFINAVAEVSTALTPEALMRELLNIEQDFGRVRPFPNAPRILDLDLLIYDDIKKATDFLTLPHPRLHLRSFVLVPLAEITSNLDIPQHGNVVKLAEPFNNQCTKIDKSNATTPNTNKPNNNLEI